MIKYLSVAEMREIEKEADRKGISYAEMMTSAGEGLARIVNSEFMSLKDQGVLGLVGPGNNGGDALVALAWLAENGWNATAILMKPRSNTDPLIIRLQEAGGPVYTMQPGLEEETINRLLQVHAVLIDGLLGTGTRLPLRSDAANLLSIIKKSVQKENRSLKVVAVDCPSGIDCDTGEAAPEVIPADITVTMAAIKQGLFQFPAFTLAGKILIVEIGLPDSGSGLDSWRSVRTFIPNLTDISSILPARPLSSHKGTFGTTLISAGCVHYPGAAYLSGKAAYLVGTGLVTMAVPATVYSALAGHFPEATWLPLPEESGYVTGDAVEIVFPHLRRASALLLGPGFGLSRHNQDYIARLFSKNAFPSPDNYQSLPAELQTLLPPTVIDADALKLISKIDQWWKIIPSNTILTPHPGEMAVLTGLAKEEIQRDRLNVAQVYSQTWGHVVVLKGAFTVIANPDGTSAIIPVATPALARAGTGDVLAGMIAGFRAQGLKAFDAAVTGAWIHAQAGIKAGEILGNTASVLASDILSSIPWVLSKLNQRE